jgi:hypothetical protein
VAVDSNNPSATAVEPVIENEIPTYRAISPMAVVSVILGLIGFFSFAETSFLAASVAAVVAGLYADWRIRRLPDVLTGRALAQVGVALGLVFGLGSLTIESVQYFIRKIEAERFAREYAGVLKDRTIAECLWYRLDPKSRQKLPPDSALVQFEKMSARDPKMFQEQVRPVKLIKDRLAKSSDSRVVLDRVEATAIDGLQVMARARLKIEAPGDGTPGENYVLLIIKGNRGRPYQWTLMRLDYPYVPGTSGADSFPIQPVDDGHGHGPGGH